MRRGLRGGSPLRPELRAQGQHRPCPGWSQPMGPSGSGSLTREGQEREASRGGRMRVTGPGPRRGRHCTPVQGGAPGHNLALVDRQGG